MRRHAHRAALAACRCPSNEPHGGPIPAGKPCSSLHAHHAGEQRDQMPRTTIIEGGTIVTPEAQFRADLIITSERISGIVSDARGIFADERIDATGLFVMPGGIDVHTHFREPEEFTKEGFTTGSHGAAAGGITTVVEMPQADPTTVTAEQFRAKRDRIRKTSIVDMALWGGIIGEPRQSANDIRDM